MFRLVSLKLALSGLAFAFTILAYQNCTQPKFSSTPENLFKTLQPGNGGPYGGKPGVFNFYNSNEPCSVQDTAGHSLPNDVILVKSDSQGSLSPFLARHSCADVEPQLLATDLARYESSSNSITYQNQFFTPITHSGDFDIVAASCPAGKFPIPNAQRTNVFSYPFDWTIGQVMSGDTWTTGWYSHDGIGVQLYSTIQSLPAFLVQRNDPNYLDYWRRTSQNITLKANTDYASTFLVQPGSVKAAQYTFYRGWTGISGDPRNEEAVITFDFQNVTAKVDWITNVANVSAILTPLGNGFICTVYFTTSATGDQGQTSIGITPSAGGQNYGQVGDSIVATAGQLVPISDFCR